MPKKNCPVCQAEVDADALKCPKGHDLKSPSGVLLDSGEPVSYRPGATSQNFPSGATPSLNLPDEQTIKPTVTGELPTRASPNETVPNVPLSAVGAGDARPKNYQIINEFRMPEVEPALTPLAVQLGSDETVHVLDAGRTDLFRWICFSPDGDLIRSVMIARGADGVKAPAGIGLDSNGRLYIADLSANYVWRCESNGVLTRINADEPLSGPLDVSVDRIGNLTVADTVACRIVKLNPVGARLFAFGAPDQPTRSRDEEEEEEESEETTLPGTLAPDRLANPSAVTTDAQGNIYVADTNHHRVLKLDANGTFVGLVAQGIELLFPSSLKCAPTGDLYVADLDGSRVHKFSADGKHIFSLTLESGAAGGKFDVDKYGNMFLASKTKQAILKVRHKE